MKLPVQSVHEMPEELSTALDACKTGLKVVVAFSFFINLLTLAAPLYMLQVFDRVIGSGSTDTLLYLTVITLAAVLAMAALEVIRGRVMVSLGVWLERRLSEPVYAACVEQASHRQEASSVQGLRDVAIVRNFLTGSAIFPIMDAPWLPLFLLIIFLLHPVLGVIATLGAIVLFALAVLNDKVSKEPLQQSAAASIEGLRQAEASVRNANVVKAMGLMANLNRRWAKSNGAALGFLAQASSRSSVVSACSKFIRMGLQIIMMGAGAWLVLGAELTPGGMVAGSILLGRALAPVDQAIGSWKGAVAARSAFDRIKNLLATQLNQKTAIELPEPEGHLQLEKVFYGYSRDLDPVLRGLSFELKAGESLGVIGPTASGKSTLANLLVGNTLPEAGNVRMDRGDIHTWTRESRCKNLGYLPQGVELFEGTITENIARMGDYEPEDVIAAAKAANVHDIILGLPEGYETNIGEGGGILSGGQRQRIALARALYGSPRFVVLDEPNANLDFSGDAALIEAMVQLKQEKVTTVVIAHRPSILKNVDKVLILYTGGRFDFGERDEMLKKVFPDPVAKPQQESSHATTRTA